VSFKTGLSRRVPPVLVPHAAEGNLEKDESLRPVLVQAFASAAGYIEDTAVRRNVRALHASMVQAILHAAFVKKRDMLE
jgi:hypothetical protein